MAGEILTGNDIIDQLQAVQKTADREFSDPDSKIETITEIVRAMGAGAILDHGFFASTSVAYGLHPDMDPNNRIWYKDGITFTARLEEFRYAYRPALPLDSLMLTFVDPQIFEAIGDDQMAEDLSKLTIEVPVLAVDSCLLMDAA
ncbi:MAG TPA: hypothetical protein VHB51_04230 [Candidatus Saccharimonadales bacterium]|nr:hypothetical protein [Candidatus Saccharimonadales bacterium]